MSVAFVDTVIVPLIVDPFDGDVIETVGGVVSVGGEQAEVVTFNVVVPELFPAASCALTPAMYVVPQTSPVLLKLRFNVEPRFLPSLNTSYPVTPTLSVEAFQDRL